jgi:uncharacterized protein (TIGR02118 family)
MFKVVVLVARKPGMSRADFIRHYETVHVPLVRSFFPEMLAYQRNYVDLAGAITYPGAAAPDFDSVTQMWFADRAGYEAMTAASTDPVKGKALADDAEMFMDTTKTRLFVVEESGAAPAAA